MRYSEDYVDYIVSKMKEWLIAYRERNCRADTPFVIGISGGKDSAVVAALCKSVTKHVVGLIMPYGEQDDLADAMLVCQRLDIPFHVVQIKGVVSVSMGALSDSIFLPTEVMKINAQARVREMLLYNLADAIGGRVANCCNASERFVGYSTALGDLEGHFSLLGNARVSTVYKLVEYFGLEDLVGEQKPPADGLCGLTDEDNLGFTYDELDEYMACGTTGRDGIDKLIREKHDNSHWKRASVNGMPTFNI